MRKKKKIQKQITLLVGVILLISNTLLVGLLLLNFNVALSGFQIPIDGQMVNYYFDDHLEAHLLIAGIIIAILATVIGTVAVYLVLGKVLYPLKSLSIHMQKADKENLLAPFEIKSEMREVDILITSFNSMNEKLRNIFENQAHFSSYVAHEFRTPLAIILTNLDVYKKQPDMDVNVVIETIKDQVTKLSKLVTQILSLVSITRIELHELIPVNLIIDEVMDDLEDYAMEKGVEVIFTNNVERSANVETVGSHDLLYQAFFNLVENAIKYNKEGGKVFINLRKTMKNIFMVVEDTGSGIQKEDREKIFEPFYRGEKEKNSHVNGNGIGLAFTKQVLDHHKSSIKLLEREEGTAFEVVMMTYDYIKAKGLL